MKKLGILIMVILAMTLLVGCDWLPFIPGPEPEPTEVLSADIEIINWVQVQDEGAVVVTYEITNTGTVDIAYYKILFKVTYVDDSEYTIWHEKEGIFFAGSEIVELLIDVSGEIARVDVMDLKLTEWKFE